MGRQGLHVYHSFDTAILGGIGLPNPDVGIRSDTIKVGLLTREGMAYAKGDDGLDCTLSKSDILCVLAGSGLVGDKVPHEGGSRIGIIAEHVHAGLKEERLCGIADNESERHPGPDLGCN